MVALTLLIHEPVRSASEGTVVPLDTRLSSYRQVLGTPTLGWLVVSGALHMFNMYAVNTFLTAFLSRYHGGNIKQANGISALVWGAVGVLGLLGSGWAADRVARVRADGQLLLSARTLLFSAPALFLALPQPPGALAPWMGLMGTGTALMFVYSVYAAIQDVVAP